MKTTTTTTREAMVSVPGAQVFTRVRGSGPVLLLVQGGDGDADGLDAIARHLVDRYTVVTYDRRGLSRSAMNEGAPPPSMETHADDAAAVLASVTAEPALVFGVSLGALLGLALLSRRPALVRRLIAHEPATTEPLPAAMREAAECDRDTVDATFRAQGALAAMRVKAASIRDEFAHAEPDCERPAPSPARIANLTFFLTHDAHAVRRYRLDWTALESASSRLVLAVGAASRGNWLHASASALAGRIGTPLVEFPGGHAGFSTHPRAFSARLLEVLGRP